MATYKRNTKKRYILHQTDTASTTPRQPLIQKVCKPHGFVICSEILYISGCDIHKYYISKSPFYLFQCFDGVYWEYGIRRVVSEKLTERT